MPHTKSELRSFSHYPTLMQKVHGYGLTCNTIKRAKTTSRTPESRWDPFWPKKTYKSRYPVPPAHVSPPDTAAKAKPAAETLAVPVCKPGAAAADAAASAEREAASVALAQLLSRCTESSETRALTNRIIEVREEVVSWES
eukprot:1160828-Pelagomonas_calceolata.AAC.10